MSYEMIAILMFSTMMLMLMTGQRVFGAIGFTEEHVLQRYTRRLWAWRDDFGSESEWAVGLGALIAAGGADRLWPLVASR